MRLPTLETLKHQTQPCGASCYITCIAMALDEEVNTLISEMFSETKAWPPHSNREIIPFLVRRGIYPEKINGIMRQPLVDSCPLIVTTLSKNNVERLHCVLVYYNANGDCVLLDPCEGRDGVEFYTTRDWIDEKVTIVEMIALYECLF